MNRSAYTPPALMGVLGNALAVAARALPGFAYTPVFASITSEYMLHNIITVRLSSEDEKMFARLIEHKAGQAAGFGLPPPIQSQLMRALIWDAYLDLTRDGHRQQRLV